MYFQFVTRLLTVVVFVLFAVTNARTQAPLVEGAVLQNTSNGSGRAVLGVTSGGSSGSQIVTLPNAAPTQNQVLSVSSVSSNTANLGWITPVTTLIDQTNVLANSINDAGGWTTNITMPTTSPGVYQFIAFARIARADSTAQANQKYDFFQVSFTSVPANYNFAISYGVECIDCEQNTTITPPFKYSCTSQGSCSIVIDPAGDTQNFSAAWVGGRIHTYVISGIINVTDAASSGNILFQFNKSGGSNLTTTMSANSYVIARRLN